MRSAAFSASMRVGALRLPDTIAGMMEASTTRSPSVPRTRVSPSVTARSSVPIRQVPQGWKADSTFFRTKASISSSERTSGPGASSSPRQGSNAFCAKISRVRRTESRSSRRSRSVER